MKYLIYVAAFLLLQFCVDAKAQLPRERVQENTVIERTFWAPTNVGLGTVFNVDGQNLRSSVIHTFGLVEGGIDRFFGMDDGANTKISLDYGINDRWSVGIGRMTFNKVVDFRTKVNLLRQNRSENIPVDVALKTSLNISTLSGVGLTFNDRLTYFASVMAAKKFDHLSVQLSPMIAHFNNPSIGNPDQLFGIGMLLNYELNNRYALSAEYLPVLGERNRLSENAMALALNIDTGGHIFQLFFASSQWHNEAFIMANNRDKLWEGSFRFGFNIHRVYGLGRN
ncbi:DUF5777 family beta-barrel protein [Gracilimonas sp.]|uniref:DUF5777 family beta-barrel protein n=1 Tax=Gracilimonas sp. TaxID=1974203 RepID=UPI002871AF58|nr:DUF5777 family beta-barrel protein [Gracilimonas sp.]